jgi:signal transduction histidine kinase/CheY-like chemotaxis protein
VSRTIAAIDARLDLRTNELTADYLVPEGITSLLVAPIRQGSELIGLVCPEAQDRARRWTPEDEHFMASIADVLALALLGGRRRLLERQLLQSQKMEAIGSLAAGVAHDFNNLLSAIVGFADLTLKRLASDAPARRSLEQIVKAAHRGGSLTRQLLTFSRRQPLPPQVLDLNAIVRDMEPMLRRLIGENITIQADLDRHIGHVLGDAGQVEQVLLNLVVNARDALSKGGMIWIETRGVADVTEHLGRPEANAGRRSVVLSVRDSGVGMTPETQARIFEPFYTTKATGEGSGLGLSTVYGIVRHMGGDVRVQSSPGQGSTFAIHLPEVDAAPDERPGATAATARRLAGDETILVVEDDEQLLALTIETLSHHGYRVMGAATGMEGLMLSEEEDKRIDLIVADVAMPLVNGPDLVACIRQARPDVKVLFMSALERTVPEAFAGDAARTAFIPKPFMPDDFVGRIRDLLDRTTPGAHADTYPIRLEDRHEP